MLAPPPGIVVGLEIDLPGTRRVDLGVGQVCYRKDDRMASGLGVRFVAMAQAHARIVRDFCIESAPQGPLARMLARIRGRGQPRPRTIDGRRRRARL